MPFDFDIHIATINTLIALCSSASCQILSRTSYGSGKRIVKISEQVVIKFGIGVTESEANNQRRTYLLFDSKVVRVLRVYRFFIEKQYGYIVMKYMTNEILTLLKDQRFIRRIARVLAHLAEISYRILGSLKSGVPRNFFWFENEDLFFMNIMDIEKYFNSRLTKDNPQLDFKQCSAILCYFDVALRNILWQENDIICLLDWECAGFYSKILEVCAQRITFEKNNEFNRILLKYIIDLTEDEKDQTKLIIQIYFNG